MAAKPPKQSLYDATVGRCLQSSGEHLRSGGGFSSSSGGGGAHHHSSGRGNGNHHHLQGPAASNHASYQQHHAYHSHAQQHLAAPHGSVLPHQLVHGGAQPCFPSSTGHPAAHHHTSKRHSPKQGGTVAAHHGTATPGGSYGGSHYAHNMQNAGAGGGHHLKQSPNFSRGPATATPSSTRGGGGVATFYVGGSAAGPSHPLPNRGRLIKSKQSSDQAIINSLIAESAQIEERRDGRLVTLQLIDDGGGGEGVVGVGVEHNTTAGATPCSLSLRVNPKTTSIRDLRFRIADVFRDILLGRGSRPSITNLNWRRFTLFRAESGPGHLQGQGQGQQQQQLQHLQQQAYYFDEAAEPEAQDEETVVVDSGEALPAVEPLFYEGGSYGGGVAGAYGGGYNPLYAPGTMSTSISTTSCSSGSGGGSCCPSPRTTAFRVRIQATHRLYVAGAKGVVGWELVVAPLKMMGGENNFPPANPCPPPHSQNNPPPEQKQRRQLKRVRLDVVSSGYQHAQEKWFRYCPGADSPGASGGSPAVDAVKSIPMTSSRSTVSTTAPGQNHHGPATCVVESNCGRWLFIGTKSGDILLFALAAADPPPRRAPPPPPPGSSFCEELPPQQKHQHLHVKTFRAHTNWVSQLLLSRDGTHLYSSSYDYGIIRWNLREVLQEGLDSGTGVGESGSGTLFETLSDGTRVAIEDHRWTSRGAGGKEASGAGAGAGGTRNARNAANAASTTSRSSAGASAGSSKNSPNVLVSGGAVRGACGATGKTSTPSSTGATSLSATLTREAVLAMVDGMVAWNADRTHTKLPAQQTAPAKASATKDHKEILLNSKLAAFVDHGSGALGGGGGGTVNATTAAHGGRGPTSASCGSSSSAASRMPAAAAASSLSGKTDQQMEMGTGNAGSARSSSTSSSFASSNTATASRAGPESGACYLEQEAAPALVGYRQEQPAPRVASSTSQADDTQAIPNTTVTNTRPPDHSAAANKPEMGGNGISLGMTSTTAPTSGGILPSAVGVSPPLLPPTSSVPGGSWCTNSIIHLVGPSHRGVPPGVVSPTSSLGGGHQSPSVLAGSSMNLGASASAMVRHVEINEGGACSTIVDEEAVVEQIDVIRQLSESAICSPSWARRLVEGSAASVSHKRKNAAEASKGANSKKMNSTKKKRTTSSPDDAATRSSRKTSASRTSGAASTTFGVASEWKPPGAFFPQEEQGLSEEEVHEDENTPEDPVDEDDVEFVMTETEYSTTDEMQTSRTKTSSKSSTTASTAWSLSSSTKESCCARSKISHGEGRGAAGAGPGAEVGGGGAPSSTASSSSLTVSNSCTTTAVVPGSSSTSGEYSLQRTIFTVDASTGAKDGRSASSFGAAPAAAGEAGSSEDCPTSWSASPSEELRKHHLEVAARRQQQPSATLANCSAAGAAAATTAIQMLRQAAFIVSTPPPGPAPATTAASSCSSAPTPTMPSLPATNSLMFNNFNPLYASRQFQEDVLPIWAGAAHTGTGIRTTLHNGEQLRELQKNEAPPLTSKRSSSTSSSSSSSSSSSTSGTSAGISREQRKADGVLACKFGGAFKPQAVYAMALDESASGPSSASSSASSGAAGSFPSSTQSHLYVASGLTVKKFETESKRFVGEYQGHHDYVIDVAISSRKMATVSDDMTAICTASGGGGGGGAGDQDRAEVLGSQHHDHACAAATTSPESVALEAQDNYRTIFACKFTRCGRFLFIVLAHVVKKWCTRTLTCVAKFEAPKNSRMINCCPSPCGSVLYVALQKSVVAFDAFNGEVLRHFHCEIGVVNNIAVA